MLRRFTKNIGRYKEGQEIDWPHDVWLTVERQSGMKLSDFSIALDNPMPKQSTLKGKFRAHPRLGSART